jgi:hypothetical protein
LHQSGAPSYVHTPGVSPEEIPSAKRSAFFWLPRFLAAPFFSAARAALAPVL